MKNKQLRLALILAIGCTAQINAHDDEDGRTAARILSPLGMSAAVTAEVVTVGQADNYPQEYADKMRSDESRQYHQNKRAQQAPSNQTSSNSTARRTSIGQRMHDRHERRYERRHPSKTNSMNNNNQDNS